MQFLNTETKGSFDTKIVPVPEGEYEGVVEKLDVRSGTSEAGNDWTALDVTWDIQDPSVAKATGRDKNTVRQSLFLDMTDNGSLDSATGKNVGLGRLREAVGQNDKSKSWSPRMLEGKRARVLVSHRVYNDEVFADVKRVSAS